ncbi:MAG: esterase/lipase family protein [Thermoplasmata archaeon]
MRGKSFVCFISVIVSLVMISSGGMYVPQSLHDVALPLSSASSQNTYVLLVHGYSPGDLSGTPSTGTWTGGVNFKQQLIDAGYTVGVVSYYGAFSISFNNGYTYYNNSYFGTANTPIQNIGMQMGIALGKIFSSGTATVDIVAHSMGGLVVLYALEHYHYSQIDLKNVIFIATPFGGSPFANVAQYLGLSSTVGQQAYQMVAGSAFLSALDNAAGNAVNNYPDTVWTVFAGNYDPWWGYIFFNGQNDGVVSVRSATYLGYNNLYIFPDLHTGFLDGLTWGGISYFEDQNVANVMLAVLG